MLIANSCLSDRREKTIWGIVYISSYIPALSFFSLLSTKILNAWKFVGDVSWKLLTFDTYTKRERTVRERRWEDRWRSPRPLSVKMRQMSALRVVCCLRLRLSINICSGALGIYSIVKEMMWKEEKFMANLTFRVIKTSEPHSLHWIMFDFAS